MQILNKSANMREDMGYRISSNGKVRDTNKEFVEQLISVSKELDKEEKSVYNIDDFEMANTRRRTSQLIRIKRMEDQKRAGYVLISGLTCIGVLTMGALIFMAIKFILFR